MQARIPHPIRHLRTSAPRRGYRPVERTEVPIASAPMDAETRAREAGGPEDSARYTCSCGMVFQASVSASVACPHCGLPQDW